MRTRYHIVMVVWGDVFTRFYADVVIPTQLSARNLPALAARADVSYHIHATPEAEAMVRASALHPALERVARVVFHRIEPAATQQRNKYALLTECHRRSLAIARAHDETLIFLGPDGIFADGCFERLHALAEEGLRAVLIPGLRADKSGFAAELRGAGSGQAESSITLPPRELVRLLTKHLHPVEQALCWREEALCSWPSRLLWRVGETGLLARCFHLHPLMLRPLQWTWKGGELDTIDGNLLSQAVPDRKRIHIVTDSDELVACELSDEIAGSAHQATPNQDCGARRVAAWMRRSTDAMQRSFARHNFLLHAEDVNGEQATLWQEAADRSDAVIARVEDAYARLTPRPAAPGSFAGDSPAG